MFSNVFSKQLKIGIRNKSNVFWTLMFPIVLGTLFYIAFGSLFKSFVSEPIKTAVIYETADEDIKSQITDFLSNLETNGKKMLDIEVMDLEKAEKLLDDEDVNGIITVTDNGRLLLKAKTNGNQTSVQESIVTAYNQSADLVEKVAAEHPDKLPEVLASISERANYIDQKDMAGENKDPYVAYFYNLMVMTALFGSMNSLRIGNNCQANMSAIGARTNASPLKRSIFQLGGFLAAYIVQTVIVFIGLAYLIFGLRIKFGGDTILIFVTTAIGSLLGIALGFFVGNLGSMAVSKKESILVAITLGSCALSGLMIGDIKVDIEEKAPIINRINPAAIMGDAYYNLNIFGPDKRFYECLIIMTAVSIALIVAGLFLGRRNSYDSI
ncbi:MAG: ABC transporter permease [Eubacterium sp.]|nr:ABC transporter permease [Eubacterium sp.]